MAIYINTKTKAYPVYQNQIQEEYSNTSFPTPFVAPEPYAPVFDSPYPSYRTMTQKAVQGKPTLVDGQWYQTWVVVELTPEQIAYNEAQAAQQNKQQASALLANTDWTSIADVGNPLKSNPYLKNQDEFISYRNVIRGIAVNPTWDAVFPMPPIAIWA